MTVRRVAFPWVQRVQNTEETLNKFKPTRLVSWKVGGRTEWEISWVGGQVDYDCVRHCVCQAPTLVLTTVYHITVALP